MTREGQIHARCLSLIEGLAPEAVFSCYLPYRQHWGSLGSPLIFEQM